MKKYNLALLFAFSFLIIPPITHADITTGLVGHWEFENNTQDTSGQGNHGTAVGGPTYVTGQINQAITFDGSSQYVDIGDLSEAEDGIYTYAAWIRTTETGNDNWFVSEGSVNSNQPIVGIVNQNGLARHVFRVDNGVSISIIGTSNINNDQWHHIVGVNDGANARLYVNSVQEGTASTPGGIITLNTGTFAQLRRASNCCFVNGSIDDVRIYNRALSQSDITELYNYTGLPACSDGVDNDGDSLIDYPNDPGCTSSTDNSEVDPDTTDPAGSLTAPTNGATVSNTITVSANASDNIGVVGVQFLLNGSNLGAEDTTAPYSLQWDTTTVTNGSYTLTARARDAAGNQTTSSPVTVTVSNVVLNPDTTAPTTPTNLSATPVSSSQINLSWTASTDPTVSGDITSGVANYIVERCQGTSCTTFTQIATPTGTTFNNTGLTQNTTYRYRVRAIDIAGNQSGSAGPLSAATQSSTGPNPATMPVNTWLEIPNTNLTAVAADPAQFPFLNRSTSRITNILDFSGAAFDTLRNRLIIWGGGHNSYDGNELYAFDVDTLTWERVNDPSEPNLCNQVNSDGTPNSRHTYNGIQYIEHADRFFGLGGALACNAGQCSTDITWTFDFNTNIWTNQSTSVRPETQCENTSAYDPESERIWWFGGRSSSDNGLWSYNYDTNTWIEHVNGLLYGRRTAVMDTNRGLLVMVGQGEVVTFDIRNSNYTPQVMSTSGGASFITNEKPGLAYDPVTDRIVGWAGGSVYSLNMDTGVWTEYATPGAPPTDDIVGVYGLWRYAPSVNAFIVYTDETKNVFFYKFSAGSGSSQCSDGVDNDSDGLTDFPNDPGCSSSSDTSEVDPDTQAPTPPTSPAATPISSSQINLSWTAATDNVGVTNYTLRRCSGSSVCIPSAILITLGNVTNYQNTGLTASTLYRYTISALDAAGNESTQSSIAQATTFAPDTTFPTASITTPIAGATVSGTTVFSANASDNVGVTQVEFLVDGSVRGTDTTAPYSINWDTTTVTNGSYTLSARARDAAGNTTIPGSITVTVDNFIPSTKFSINDRVYVSFGPLNVRSCAGTTSCSILGTQATYNQGTVIGGPTFANNMWWWQIDYDSVPDGWSVEDFLEEVPVLPSVIGDCSSEPQLSGRTDIVMCEPWESTTWYDDQGFVADGGKRPANLVNPATQLQYSTIISSGCVSGNCLQLLAEEGANRALSVHWPLTAAGLQPEELYFRYYLKIGSTWDARQCDDTGTEVWPPNGKFPGIVDVRVGADPSGQCGNGGASADGINCWSGRGLFHGCENTGGAGSGFLYENTCEFVPGAITRIGSYIYHFDQANIHGSNGLWDFVPERQTMGDNFTYSCRRADPNNIPAACYCNSQNNVFCGQSTGGMLLPEQWYSVEMYVKMNTPGVADGVMRGWVDGLLSYEKTNMIYRDVGHDNLHARTIWLDVYKGGVHGNCQDGFIYLDNMVVATDAPIGPRSVSPPVTIPGDLNNDGSVNTLDWGIMNLQWFTSDPTSDLNNDGLVNSIDFGIMNSNWG